MHLTERPLTLSGEQGGSCCLWSKYSSDIEYPQLIRFLREIDFFAKQPMNKLFDQNINKPEGQQGHLGTWVYSDIYKLLC